MDWSHMTSNLCYYLGRRNKRHLQRNGDRLCKILLSLPTVLFTIGRLLGTTTHTSNVSKAIPMVSFMKQTVR